MDLYEQKLISDVLNMARLTSLPKKADMGKVIWIEAVAKIRLADNSIGYGIVKRNTDLTYRVTYINGATSAIVKAEEIYPYIILDNERIKKFAPQAKEQPRIEYLKSLKLPYAATTDFESMNIEELNKEIVKAAVYQQLKALEE